MTTGITFIGQQSWLVDVADTRFLVDPMLTRSFGHSSRLRFEVFPAREVAVDELPALDAVVITNEHLDHFHLPSLAMLPAEVPIVMAAMMPAVCVDAVKRLGREVMLVPLGEEVRIGNAELVLTAGGEDVPVWENRVASLYLKPAGETGGGVFIQSDTALPEAAVPGCDPDIFIATHNGQIAPAGQLGAFDNMLPVPTENAPQVTGLELLFTLLEGLPERFPRARWVALSGGGYVQVPPKHGTFLWGDYSGLAEVANQLTLRMELLDLTPGEAAYVTDDRVTRLAVPWIHPAEPSVPVPVSDPDATDEVDLGLRLEPLFDEPLDDAQRAAIVDEVQQMAPLLMQAALGRRLINENVYLQEAVGSRRFVLYLQEWAPGQDAALVLDLNTARFAVEELSMRDALFSIPSGVYTNASDLYAVITGRIHVWELAVSRLRQWYPGVPLESPVGFLYGYFSEQLRPDLARRMYDALVPAA
jgi:hypothetical protein